MKAELLFRTYLGYNYSDSPENAHITYNAHSIHWSDFASIRPRNKDILYEERNTFLPMSCLP